MAKRLRGMGLPQYQSVVDEKGWTGKIALVPEALDKPLHWRKPRRVFVGSMTDLFHESLTLGDLTPVWQSMADAPQHIYQILTKRAKRMMHAVGAMKGYFPVPHLWSGVTVENQQAADGRRDDFRNTPAAVKFVSYEPALEVVDWTGWEFINQIIIGCESGPRRRPMPLDIAFETVAWARENGIAPFVKQLDIDGKVSHNPAEWPEWARVREYPR